MLPEAIGKAKRKKAFVSRDPTNLAKKRTGHKNVPLVLKEKVFPESAEL